MEWTSFAEWLVSIVPRTVHRNGEEATDGVTGISHHGTGETLAQGCNCTTFSHYIQQPVKPMLSLTKHSTLRREKKSILGPLSILKINKIERETIKH